LFNDEEDFQFFKGLLIQAKTKAKFRIYHYCFMQTHFHLAVRRENGPGHSKGTGQNT